MEKKDQPSSEDQSEDEIEVIFTAQESVPPGGKLFDHTIGICPCQYQIGYCKPLGGCFKDQCRQDIIRICSVNESGGCIGIAFTLPTTDTEVA